MDRFSGIGPSWIDDNQGFGKKRSTQVEWLPFMEKLQVLKNQTTEHTEYTERPQFTEGEVGRRCRILSLLITGWVA